jgi:hypothetical protein
MELCDYGEAVCDNHDVGCDWEGILRDKFDHMDNCPFEKASIIVSSLQLRCSTKETENKELKRKLEHALREVEQKKIELQLAANEMLRIQAQSARQQDYVYVQTTRPQHRYPTSQHHSDAKQAEGCTIS